MRKNSFGIVCLGLISFIFLQACKNKPAKHIAEDTFTSGKVSLAADESFATILEQEQYVFESLNSSAHLNITYKSENEVINRLLNDSVRVAVIARELSPQERSIIEKRKLKVDALRFAVDAITLIVNKASADTTITVSMLKKMLNGQVNTNKIIVFDNPNSSLVRYLKDFSGSKEFKEKNIYALKTNVDVIKYVSQQPNAIGIIGFGWLNDAQADYAAYVNNIQVVGVRDEASKQYPDGYFKPSQETLVLKQYPLSRGLYIVNCTSKVGLATGFESFLASDRGQRIILRSGLLPDTMPGREINLIK